MIYRDERILRHVFSHHARNRAEKGIFFYWLTDECALLLTEGFRQ